MPVPDSDTVCGLSGTLSSSRSAPAREPACVGANAILTLHALPAESVDLQVLAVIVKPALTVIPLMFSTAVPVFVRVTDFAALVVFTACYISNFIHHACT
jgi:hypothetical protein